MASFLAQVNVADMGIPAKIIALMSQERKIAENCTSMVVVRLLGV